MFSYFRRIFLVGFVTSLLLHTSLSDKKENENYFLKFVDNAQNPCENFYSYACGSWQQILGETHEEFRDLEGYLKLRYIELLADGFERRMRTQTKETNAVYKKAQDFYDSCRKTLNLKVFQYVEVLKAKYEDLNWLNILHNGNVSLAEKDWNWLKILGRLRSYGFNDALLTMTVVRTSAKSSILKFGRPQNIEFDAIEQLALEPLDPELRTKLNSFKQQLSTLGSEEGSTKSLLLNATSFSESFNIANIYEYFEMLPKSLPIDNLQFQIDDVNYMRALHAIISETSQDVVAYFIGLKFVSYIRAQVPKSSDSIDCLAAIKTQVPEILNLIYSEQYYASQRQKTDEIIDEIFRNLKSKFLEILTEHAESLDAESLAFLQQKILLMQLNIGQIPVDADIDFYENYFRELEIETEDLNAFYRNHLNSMRFRVFKQLEQLDTSATAPEYIFHGYRNGPVHDIYANLVIFPYSLLQMPIFDAEDNRLFHYAGIASIIAHDMAHAFDPSGLKYDAEGNPSSMFEKILKENSHFQNALTCLQKRPTQRLNEKIADFVGSRVAYDVYFKNLEPITFEMHWNMTKKQIFFVKFSQFYCVTDTQTTSEEPEKWLSQIVENNEEFHEVFHCPKQKNYEACKFW